MDYTVAGISSPPPSLGENASTHRYEVIRTLSSAQVPPPPELFRGCGEPGPWKANAGVLRERNSVISVSLTMTEGASSRRVRVLAATLKRTLELTGFDTADGLVSLTSPLLASDILDDEPFAGRRKQEITSSNLAGTVVSSEGMRRDRAVSAASLLTVVSNCPPRSQLRVTN